MKMTKIESARIIVKNEGACNTVSCKYCFMGDGVCGFVSSRPEKIKFAEAYIKRHESKSKKKDHILDTTKKVEEPKQVGIDNSDVTLALTAQHEPTPLQIAKMIRDNGYSCLGLNDNALTGCYRCPLGKFDCGSMIDTADLQEMALRKKLIDDYIAQHDHIVDKHEMVEPKPISFDYPVPEYVYIVYASVIRCYVVIGGFKKVIDKNLDGSIRETFTIYAVPITEESGEWLDAKGCYRTPEEALQVAKKLWGSK